NEAAVRAECHAENQILVLPAEGVERATGGGLPEPHRALAGGGEGAAIGAVRHAVDGGGVLAEGAALAAARDVPELDRVVLAGGGEGAAIGAVRHAVDDGGVPAEGVPFLAGVGVPELDRGIIAGGSDGAAVRAEGHRPEPRFVPVEGVEQ